MSTEFDMFGLTPDAQATLAAMQAAWATMSTDMAARIAAENLETSDRIAADLILGDATNAEAATRAAADTVLAGRLTSLFGIPTSKTVAFATAYQAANSAKPAIISVLIDTTVTVGIGAPTTNTVEMITGPTNAVAGGTGALTDRYRNDLSVTLISLGFTGSNKLTAFLPAGYWFAVRRTVGTGSSVNSAFEQAVG